MKVRGCTLNGLDGTSESGGKKDSYYVHQMILVVKVRRCGLSVLNGISH